jgi:hypothetical protein
MNATPFYIMIEVSRTLNGGHLKNQHDTRSLFSWV